MKTKTFDAVEMKRRGAQAIYAVISQLSPEQQLAYWQQRTQMLRQQQQKAQHAPTDAEGSGELLTITEHLAQANYTGGRLFKTVEEVDAYIREERDSWER